MLGAELGRVQVVRGAQEAGGRRRAQHRHVGAVHDDCRRVTADRVVREGQTELGSVEADAR